MKKVQRIKGSKVQGLKKIKTKDELECRAKPSRSWDFSLTLSFKSIDMDYRTPLRILEVGVKFVEP